MKTLAFAAFAAGALTFASCEEDDPIPVDPRDSNRAPTLTIENPDMSMTDGRVEVGEDQDGNSLNGSLFSFTLDGDDPDNNMRTIRVQRDGQNVASGSADVRIEFDGVTAPLAGNEPLLFGNDQGSFSKEVQVRAPENFEDSTTYAFIVTDTFGLSDTAMVMLVTGDAPTPLSSAILRDRVFSNDSGPDRGAIDLDTGDAISTVGGPTGAELEDNGNSTSGWAKTVSPVNGATLRVIPPTAENMNAERFRNTTTVDGLLSLYDEAANDIGTTDPITVNTLAIVKRDLDDGGERFYLVLFTAVTETADNNRDSYTVSIKQTN